MAGKVLELKHNQLTLLPCFAVNREYSLLKFGKKESVPIFAMAYYGSDLFGNDHDKLAIATHVKERLGIKFD